MNGQDEHPQEPLVEASRGSGCLPRLVIVAIGAALALFIYAALARLAGALLVIGE